MVKGEVSPYASIGACSYKKTFGVCATAHSRAAHAYESALTREIACAHTTLPSLRGKDAQMGSQSTSFNEPRNAPYGILCNMFHAFYSLIRYPRIALKRILQLVACIGMGMTCCAQVPYEYFQIENLELVEADAISTAETRRVVAPDAAVMPDSLVLDDQTQRAGHLTLVDPFVPQVGVYKRLAVFSEIGVDATGALVLKKKEAPSCREFAFREKRRTEGVYRSAYLRVDAKAGVRFDIPSSSHAMEILAFRVTNVREASQRVAYRLQKCDGDVYAATVEKSGIYDIEYETFEPIDGAIPTHAEFFDHAYPNVSISERDLATEDNSIYSRLHRLFFDTPLDPRSNRRFGDVIRFIQSFESASLSHDSALTSDSADKDDIFRRILREKKGVCRHRAFLLAGVSRLWGYESRVVVNEAHAFVEIRYRGSWHIIELGGTAESIQIMSADGKRLVSSHEASWEERGLSVPAHEERQKLLFHESNGTSEKSFFRDEALVFNGCLSDASGKKYRNKNVILSLSNDFNPKMETKVQKDERGCVEIQIQLPFDWKLGKSQVEWLGESRELETRHLRE